MKCYLTKKQLAKIITITNNYICTVTEKTKNKGPKCETRQNTGYVATGVLFGTYPLPPPLCQKHNGPYP